MMRKLRLARLARGTVTRATRDNDRAPYLASVMKEALAHLRCGKTADAKNLLADALEDYTGADGTIERPFQ